MQCRHPPKMWTRLWISFVQQKMTKTGRQLLPICLIIRHCDHNVHTTKSMVGKTLGEGYVGKLAAVIPDILYRGSRFSVFVLASKYSCQIACKNYFHAGFRPRRRGTFVSENVPRPQGRNPVINKWWAVPTLQTEYPIPLQGGG